MRLPDCPALVATRPMELVENLGTEEPTGSGRNREEPEWGSKIHYTWRLGQGTLELNMWGREGSGFWRQIHWWLHLRQTLDQRIQQALPRNKGYLRDVLLVGQVTLICCMELLVWICLCDYNFMYFAVSALLILYKAYIIKDRDLTLYFVWTATDGKIIVKWRWIF